jgi:hypothetical protein
VFFESRALDRDRRSRFANDVSPLAFTHKSAPPAQTDTADMEFVVAAAVAGGVAATVKAVRSHAQRERHRDVVANLPGDVPFGAVPTVQGESPYLDHPNIYEALDRATSPGARGGGGVPMLQQGASSRGGPGAPLPALPQPQPLLALQDVPYRVEEPPDAPVAQSMALVAPQHAYSFSSPPGMGPVAHQMPQGYPYPSQGPSPVPIDAVVASQAMAHARARSEHEMAVAFHRAVPYPPPYPYPYPYPALVPQGGGPPAPGRDPPRIGPVVSPAAVPAVPAGARAGPGTGGGLPPSRMMIPLADDDVAGGGTRLGRGEKGGSGTG